MLLDTDVLVDIERGRQAALTWVATLTDPPFVSGFAALELTEGAANRAQFRRIRKFLDDFPLIWPTAADMTRAFEKYAVLRLSHGLGLLDSLIAATSVGCGEDLVTFNRKHFDAVPGLVSVQPYIR